jgi:DNA-binding phage protein
MSGKRPRKAKRIYRELTDEERSRIAGVRRQVERELPELREKAKMVFAAHEAARRVVAQLKAERTRRGISLADVMNRSGITREAISKLENSEAPNPTVKTLVRYAAAIGLDLQMSAVAKPLK